MLSPVDDRSWRAKRGSLMLIRQSMEVILMLLLYFASTLLSTSDPMCLSVNDGSQFRSD